MSNRRPHKTSYRLFALLVLAFLAFSIHAQHSCAYEVVAEPVHVSTIKEPESGIVEQFMLQGLKCYQENDTLGAVDSFARALLLDPANKTARKTLASINEQASLPAEQRIQLFLSEDLFALNENLQKKLGHFTLQRDAMAAALIQQNYPQTAIDQKFQAIRDRFALPAGDREKDSGSLRPLEALNKFLTQEQKRLSWELSRVKEQLSWLQETKKPPTRPEHRMTRAEPGASWQQIAGVREELGELRRQVQALQDDVQGKDDRITALTKQVVEFSLKLTEREMVLSEKVNALGSLHEAYAELQSRQELGQKILEEKNVQIQSLQEGLAALQADTALHTKEISGLIAAKDQALDQWEKILAIYQGKLKDTTQVLDARDRDVVTLQEQLALVQTKLFEKETALQKTKEKLVSLEKQFQAVVSGSK